MGETIRVLVLGTGQMGSGIARLLLEKEGLQLVGAYGKRAERAGMDLGLAIGLDRKLGIKISNRLDQVIEQTQPHVAIQATCSKLTDAVDDLSVVIGHGVSAISIAEEMVYPVHRSPEIASKLHQLALAHGASVIGTGINPGFVFDLLIIVLTGVCSDIQTIYGKRVNDLSPYGPTVLSSQGVGLSPEAFRRGLKEGSMVGHLGFAESIHMIGNTLGWEIDRIEERREPIISSVRRGTPFIIVEPGQVAGCLHTAKAYRGNRAVITLVHPQQVQPQLEGVKTGDTIEITGTPDISITGIPEIPGGKGTIALAVNMIPLVLGALPGLHTMVDLPVPAAMLSDARDRVHRRYTGIQS